MSNQKKTKKKVVKTIKTSDEAGFKAKAVRSSRSAKTSSSVSSIPLIFNKQNYIIMGVGVLLMILGFILMSGGGSENYAEFNADEIFSFRRITLAPFLVILGLLVNVYAIFKK